MASLNPSTQYRHVILQVWETFGKKDVENLKKLLNMPEPLHEAEELRDMCDTTGLLSLDNINNFIKIIDQLHLKKASRILINFRRKYITQTTLFDEQCSVHGSKKLIFICLSCQQRLCQDCKVPQHAKSCEKLLTLEDYFEEVNEAYDQISKKVSSLEQVIASICAKQKNYRQQIYNNRASVSQSLKRDYDNMMKTAEMVKSNLLQDISSQELSKTEKLLEVQLQLEGVNRILRTTKDSTFTPGDLLNRIKKATEKLKILEQVDKALTESIELLRKRVTEITYSCSNNDGVFGEITIIKPYKISTIEEKNISSKTETFESFPKQLPSPTILPISQKEIDGTVKGFKEQTSTRDTYNENIKPSQLLRHNPIPKPDLSYQEMNLDEVVPTTSGKSNHTDQLQTFTSDSYFSISTSDISKEPEKSSLGKRDNPGGSYVNVSKPKDFVLKIGGKYVVRKFIPKKEI